MHAYTIIIIIIIKISTESEIISIIFFKLSSQILDFGFASDLVFWIDSDFVRLFSIDIAFNSTTDSLL